MTLQEIINQYYKFIKGDGMDASVGMDDNEVKAAIKRWALERVGEDETPESGLARALKISEISIAHQAVEFHGRNQARQEIRERIKKAE